MNIGHNSVALKSFIFPIINILTNDEQNQCTTAFDDMVHHAAIFFLKLFDHSDILGVVFYFVNRSHKAPGSQIGVVKLAFIPVVYHIGIQSENTNKLHQARCCFCFHLFFSTDIIILHVLSIIILLYPPVNFCQLVLCLCQQLFLSCNYAFQSSRHRLHSGGWQIDHYTCCNIR